jgi:hypothetical protein
MENNNKSKQLSESEKTKIMKDIEKRTQEMVILATKSGKIENPINIISGIPSEPQKIRSSINILQDIMKSGAEDFEKKTGRQMTYSEMREMYG